MTYPEQASKKAGSHCDSGHWISWCTQEDEVGVRRKLWLQSREKRGGLVGRDTMRHDVSNNDQEGRSLVWVLGQMRGMIETQHLERIEAKLTQLQATAESRGLITNGNDGTDAQARLPN